MKKLIYVFFLLNVSYSINAQWVQRYNGTGNIDDIAYSSAIDGSGNIYVTGKSKGVGSDFDYATIKYNPSGVQQWAVRYNGAWNKSDVATSIAVDASGNVYVTGGSLDTLTSVDYATVKYNSSGVQLWAVRYNGPGNGIDWANSLTVDGSGNVFVTGSSTGNGTDRDFATVKYNSFGVQQWVQRFNGPVNSFDGANSVALDGSGNVYVSGGGIGIEASTDYVIIKYNTFGIEQWVQRFNDPRNSADMATSMAVDATGNVYVTGKSFGININYLTIKFNSSGVQQWSQVYNGTGNYDDIATAIAVDASGFVYVTGKSTGSTGGFDYATIKYNPSGIQQWVQRYNGPGNYIDWATSLAIDAIGECICNRN